MKLAGLIVLAQLALPPVPPNPVLTDEEFETLKAAALHLQEKTGLDIPNLQKIIGPTQLPRVGMALSWSSNDPKACALLKKIEPSAVCMK